MITDQPTAPSSRRWPSRRWARAVLAVLLVPLVLAVEPMASPVSAVETILPASKVQATNSKQPPPPWIKVPSCGSINIDGGGGATTWRVTSEVGSGSVVHPGRTWTVVAEIDAKDFYDTGVGNDGPDPLHLRLAPSGPTSPGAPPAGFYDPKYNEGKDAVGAIGPLGNWGYRFDANSKPKGGFINDSGDGAFARLTVTVEATAPGVITMPVLQVFGYDSTPIAGEFSCTLPLEWSWTVVAPQAPVASPESVTVDARYPSAVVGDANGGSHAVAIDVLANDDDPNVAGGPGDPAQVRLASWPTTSAAGGTVNCGSQAQNGAPKGTPFNQLATGPCTYQPPLGHAGPDSFTYTIRSVTGELQATTTASIQVRPNRAPSATAVVFGTAVNQDGTFDLAAGVGDLDGDPVTCSLAAPPVPAVGTAAVTPGCELVWDNTSPGFTGNVTVDYRVCDTHPTLAAPELGAGVTRTAGYAQGSPDDLSASTSRRCTVATATIPVLPGLILPPTAGADLDVVDAGYASDDIGTYSLRIPVLDNDVDGNGPAPAVPGVELEIATTPDPAEGTASVDGDRVVFTPADGFSGPVSFTYRVCEDPLLQDPVYLDDPDTPLVDEGLPFCGLGTVGIDVVGNAAPIAGPDEAVIAHTATLQDLDLGANDVDPEGGALSCTPGVPSISDPMLVVAATVDAQCRLDLDPADGADGVVEVTYEVCDAHTLTAPAHPAIPYGTDGRSPGDAAPRCSSGVATITVVGPAPGPVDPHAGDSPPICTADTAQTTTGTTVSIDVIANDTDLDADQQPSPVILTGPPSDEPANSVEGGQAAMDEGGTVVIYEPAAGFIGIDTFSYTARDEIGQGCVGQVTVNVVASPDGGGTGQPVSTGTNPTALAGAGSAGTTGALPATGSPHALVLVAMGLALVAIGATATGTGRRLRR